MVLSRRTLVVMAAGGSMLALLGALVSQYGFGLFPCPLCIWQRWPHLVAIAIGVGALAMSGRALPALGAVAALTTAGIGGYHVGVEQGWWQGLASCAGGPGLSGLSVEALLDPTLRVPSAPRCDEIAFAFLGLSMAAWNAIFSLGLAALWLAAAFGNSIRPSGGSSRGK